jgi:hypothetical protein
VFEQTASDQSRALAVPALGCRVVLHKVDPRATEYEAGYKM